MKNFKNWYMLFTTVLIIILLVRVCSPSIVEVADKKDPPEVISSNTEKDSARVIEIHTIDTVDRWHEGKVVYITPDSSLVDSSDSNNVLVNYYYGKQDSSLHYSIIVNSKERPNSVNMNYKVMEREINDYTLIKDSISTTITQKVRVNQLYFGGGAIVYPKFNAVYLGLDLVSKKGWQAGVGAGVMIDDKALFIKADLKKLITFRGK